METTPTPQVSYYLDLPVQNSINALTKVNSNHNIRLDAALNMRVQAWLCKFSLFEKMLAVLI